VAVPDTFDALVATLTAHDGQAPVASKIDADEVGSI
jgi:hypothetical protein